MVAIIIAAVLAETISNPKFSPIKYRNGSKNESNKMVL